MTLALLALVAALQDPILSRTVVHTLGAEHEGGFLHISPDGSRAVHVDHGRRSIYVDGTPIFDGQHLHKIAFSPDGSKYAIAAIKDASTSFLFEGQKPIVKGKLNCRGLGFLAGSLTPWFETSTASSRSLTIGDKDAGFFSPNFGGPILSPDGSRISWHYMLDAGGRNFALGVDGVEIARNCPSWPPAYSADGKRVIYGYGQRDDHKMFVDGKEVGTYFYAGPGLFSADGKHYAYSAAPKGERKYRVYLDGKPVDDRTYDWASAVAPNRDASRLAVAENRSGKVVLTLDGKESGPHDALILHTQFDPSGTWHHFIAVRDKKSILFINGEEQKGERFSSPAFTANGSHCAFVAARGEDSVVVINGKDVHTYRGYAPKEIRLSQDGKRWALASGGDGSQFTIVDGTQSAAWKEVDIPVFTLDGAHAGFRAMKDNRWRIVFDGKEIGSYGEMSDIVATADGKLAFVATEGKDVVRVTLAGK